MPDNEAETNTRQNSLTRPERTAHITILAVWIMFAASCALLVTGDRILIALGIGITVFCVMILATTSVLAFAVISRKMALNAKQKISPFF